MKDFEPKAIINEKVNTTIRIDSDTLEEIDILANEINISRNELINQCIKYALDNLNTRNRDKKTISS